MCIRDRYDNSSYRVTVTITDDGSGQLKMTGHTITKDDETANSATFTNTYSAEPVQVTLTAYKSLVAKVGTRDLQANEFSFELCDENETVVSTAKNAADGKVAFAPLTFKDVGEKTYIIREVKGDLGGITYDTNKYVVSFSINDNGDGQLKAPPCL